MKSFSLFLFFFSFAIRSHAFVLQNPVGHRETLLGNAGTALPASSGNPLFNPAGLGFYENDLPNFSLSGTAVTGEDSSSDQYQKSSNSLTSRTLLSVASFPIERNIRIAPFYSFPQDSTLYGYADTSTGGVRNRTAETLTLKSAAGGLSYGGPIIPDVLTWGYAVGVLWSDQESHLNTLSESTGQSSLTSVHDIKTNAQLYFNQGIMWKATPNYYLGLSVTVSPIQFYQDGSHFVQKQQSGSTTGEQDFFRYSPDQKHATAVTLGQSFLNENWDFLFDINYIASDPLYADPAWQIAAGVRRQILPRASILAGFNYLRTDDVSQYFATGGILVDYRTYEFVLGVSYKRSDYSTDNLNFQTNSVAFIFSSSIAYAPF